MEDKLITSNQTFVQEIKDTTETNELVIFETADQAVTLNVPVNQETVWLNQAQMAELFSVDRSVITRHVNNVFKENEVDKKSNVQKMHIANADRPVQYYSLDIIISVGYRVKSQRGVEFRRWANSVLRQYIMQGYAINERRLQVLQKTVDIQTRMLADALQVEEQDILTAVTMYTDALELLDQYDHQSLRKPRGSDAVYRITYTDCRKMIDAMEDSFHSDVFGVEKEAGKVEGILATIYQNVSKEPSP
ncbi:MAG: RhuM family protein [Eubacteriales bacterium]|nr:RhuM family protein [Eubacteriales bacterium]